MRYFQLFLMSAHIVIGFCISKNPYIPNSTLSYRSAALFYISIPLSYAMNYHQTSKNCFLHWKFVYLINSNYCMLFRTLVLLIVFFRHIDLSSEGEGGGLEYIINSKYFKGPIMLNSIQWNDRKRFDRLILFVPEQLGLFRFLVF